MRLCFLQGFLALLPNRVHFVCNFLTSWAACAYFRPYSAEVGQEFG